MHQPRFLFPSILVLSATFLYSWLTKGIPSRLDANHAPKSRFELVRVDSYDFPARAGGIDIIFVHGLGSNPDTTWGARRPQNPVDQIEGTPSDEQYVNWVKEFLPNDLPLEIRKEARIFFYNYDSYWKKDAVYTRLPTIGNNLLEHIDGQIHRSKNEEGRCLIFVGHSYGGLVVKEALIQAKRRREFSNVVEQTRAILFLGTPHRGSSFGPWGWLLAYVLQPLGSNPLILANLEYDAIPLRDLHEQFITSVRDDLQVVNFYEQRPIRLLKLWLFQWQGFTVPESSATYDGKKVSKIGLPVNHYGLNKFASRSESYNSILSKLVKLITPLLKPTKHHYDVPVETVQAFIQRDQIWEELGEKLQIRHEKATVPYAVTLHGLGGSGKSQLALKYAEVNRDRYNPILWIDATSEETVRSSFTRCATNLGLPDEPSNQQRVSLTDDRVIQGVLRWLRDRAETDDEWLFIVDNVDDVSWGIKKIIPKGVRGRILITSRDEQSQKLVDRGCEQIRVDVMSPREASMVLLRHLSDKIDLLPKTVRDGCDEVAKKLGYLPLAIDLAGAYIGNSLTPEQSLTQYLEDYEKHRDELLQMDHLRGLTPTERTVWTVWDTTLRKIEREYTQWHPGLLLTFLANFHGNIVQNEMFRLASHGMFAVNHELGEENFTELQTFIRTTESEWDDFKYRKSVDVLVRYSLIQRVHGHWPGTTIHSLVKWRAIRRDQDQQWQCFYIRFLMAACSEITEEDHKPEFRRHLILHIPDVKNLNLSCIGITKLGEAFVWKTLARVFFDEGRWEEAEQLLMLLIENHESTLGSDHPKTLYSMIGLAATYWSQGRYAEAEQIQVQVMQTNQKKFGEDHIDTLSSMAKLASTYWSQGRYDEAEQIQVQVMQTSQKKFGEDHPYTLQSMLKLASTYWNRGRRKEAEQLHVQVLENSERTPDLGRPMTLMSLDKLAASFRRQGRWEEAEQMQVQAIEIRKRKLGSDHHDTLISMNNLASTYQKQGRWKEAEQVQVQAIEIRKRKFGSDHHDTLISMNNLASTYRDQGRWEEAEQLLVQVIQTSKTKLGEDHPDTLISMANLASTYRNQGRWEEAEQI